MFIDKIKFNLQLNGQTFSKKNLTLLSTNKHGWITYSFGLEHKMQLRYNEKEDKIKIWGSLPYFLNGHSFYSNFDETRKAIALISDLIDLDILDGIVEKFDFGTVIHTAASPSSVFQNHVSLDHFFIRTSKHAKFFIDRVWMLNLYDAEQTLLTNAKKEVQNELWQKGIYDPNFLSIKFEVRIRNTEIWYGRPIKIEEIIMDTFNDYLEIHLGYQYSRIKVVGDELIHYEEEYL